MRIANEGCDKITVWELLDTLLTVSSNITCRNSNIFEKRGGFFARLNITFIG